MVEVEILAALGEAFQLLFRPQLLLYIILGVAIGTMLAVIPGVGALMGMALLLPFTFVLDAHTAIAFMLAALAIMTTADAIPAILFGVPGTPGSMATVLDGYPMAKKGEAGRALGAAFTSSVIGGVIGAALLMLAVPIVMPLMLATTSTELLAFCILGLSMVAALSGGSMFKGLAAAGIGILFAFIGMDSQTATLRWTFGSVYLWDGVHILVVVLGIYAIPELADLAIERASIAKDKKGAGQMSGGRQGVRDTLSNMGIVTRSSGLGAVFGTLPAVGASVIPWIVYSYTSMRTKGKSEFGKGDVRGVIAVESANNATVGGALLPTIALGIPGSAPMALLLGAFMLQGVAPGPSMLSDELSFTFMMVLTLVVANIIGGGMAFLLAVQLARIVFVRVTVLVPIILSIVFIGAVQASRQWEDVFFLLAIGLVGWLMKRVRWSRSPLVLAFILAPLVEQYFFISTRLHGWEWVIKPAPFVILAFTAALLIFLGVRSIRRTRKAMADGQKRAFRPSLDADTLTALAVCAVAVAAYVSAGDWGRSARMMPQIAAGFTFFTALGALVLGWWKPVTDPTGAHGGAPSTAPEPDAEYFDIATDFGDLHGTTIAVRAAHYGAFLLLFAALAYTVGVLPAVPIFILAYMLTSGESWRITIPVAVATSAGTYFLFTQVLSLAWPAPIWNVLAWIG